MGARRRSETVVEVGIISFIQINDRRSTWQNRGDRFLLLGNSINRIQVLCDRYGLLIDFKSLFFHGIAPKVLASACSIKRDNNSHNVLIRWRLAVVMAERDISNKELASLIEMHPRSVSRLKTRRRLTRIDEDTLNALCKALNCQPGDLMVYEPDV